MKRIVLCSLVLLLIPCSQTENLSPKATAKVVVESFYHGDKITLKKHTTLEGYSNLVSIQDMFVQKKNSKSNFKIIDEVTDGDVSWVKYSKEYDPVPDVLKLVKEDGKWVVTHNGPRDKGPF